MHHEKYAMECIIGNIPWNAPWEIYHGIHHGENYGVHSGNFTNECMVSMVGFVKP